MSPVIRNRRRRMEQDYWAMCEVCIRTQINLDDSDLAQLSADKISFLFMLWLIEIFNGKPARLASIGELANCLQISDSCCSDDNLVQACVERYIMNDDDGIIKAFHNIDHSDNPYWEDLSPETQVKLLRLYKCISVCFCKIAMRHERIAARTRDFLLRLDEQV